MTSCPRGRPSWSCCTTPCWFLRSTTGSLRGEFEGREFCEIFLVIYTVNGTKFGFSFIWFYFFILKSLLELFGSVKFAGSVCFWVQHHCLLFLEILLGHPPLRIQALWTGKAKTSESQNLSSDIFSTDDNLGHVILPCIGATTCSQD